MFHLKNGRRTFIFNLSKEVFMILDTTRQNRNYIDICNFLLWLTVDYFWPPSSNIFAAILTRKIIALVKANVLKFWPVNGKDASKQIALAGKKSKTNLKYTHQVEDSLRDRCKANFFVDLFLCTCRGSPKTFQVSETYTCNYVSNKNGILRLL